MKNTSFSIRIMYWAVEVIYWLIMISMGLIIILLIAQFFGASLSGQFSFTWPVYFDVLEEGSVVNSETYGVWIRDASGKLMVEGSNNSAVNSLMITLLILLGVVYVIVRFIRKLVSNFKAGRFFILSNMTLLRRISLGLLGFWIVKHGVQMFLTSRNVANFNFENIQLKPNLNFDLGLAIFAIFLLALSHIFAEGARLKNEEELTI